MELFDGNLGHQRDPQPTRAADGSRLPIVFARDGEVYTNSQHVAAYFGKRHDHVLRDIDEAKAHSPDLGNEYFQEVSQDHPTVSGRKIRSFDLTKDGFALIVMGYTGPKAMPFKLAYIAQYKAMEAELRARPALVVPDFSDPAVLLRLLAEQAQGRVEDQRRAVEAEAKVEEVQGTLGRLEGAEGSMCITDAAKTLKFAKADDLFQRLAAMRWIFKREPKAEWRAFQDKIAGGLMEHDDHIYFDRQKRERVRTRALVTAKGLVKLAEILSKPLH